MLRKGCTLDVAHARVRGRHQAIYALSDDHLEDDWGKTGHTRLTLPPNPIGWALSRAADRFGITCRQWTMQNGTRVWNEIRRETRQAEIDLSMPPGTVEGAVQAMEEISMEDLTDIREIMEEMGLDNWEDPAEDPAGVKIERRADRRCHIQVQHPGGSDEIHRDHGGATGVREKPGLGSDAPPSTRRGLG